MCLNLAGVTRLHKADMCAHPAYAGYLAGPETSVAIDIVYVRSK
jgi:hypothetical protein